MLRRLRDVLRARRTSDVESGAEDLRQVIETPARFFARYTGRAYDWARSPTFDAHVDSLPDIYVNAGGSAVAWVERITVSQAAGRATLGHFAVHSQLVRRGLGRSLAHALGLEFQLRFGITELVFSEDSPNYEQAGYEDFFRSLGAIPVVAQPGWRPEWLWHPDGVGERSACAQGLSVPGRR